MNSPTSAETSRDHDWIMARVEEMKALGETEPRLARDPVNQPMINNWLEAIGEDDPRYRSGEAPPAMAQVWTMYGLDPHRPAGDPLHGTMRILDEAGYTSVLGTNCDQVYVRPVRVGEEVTLSARLESVKGPKQTGVGEGYFITTENTWRVGDEVVATMLFRVLKYKPGSRPQATPKVDRTKLVRPQMNRDTEFFWEGTAAGELRIQKCNACGELRH
ncbi:MAG: FAS1-like dehydratase domain-containing protein, partial [Marmoricola sp.]